MQTGTVPARRAGTPTATTGFGRPRIAADQPHPWRLVAPWYRWARVGETGPDAALRAVRPALHKYASTDFVTRFLGDPQVSLAFDDGPVGTDGRTAVDLVQRITTAPAGVPIPGETRRRSLAGLVQEPTSTRKLFQPAHQRFYLVAVGLHCDAIGLPRVDPVHVAEVGFVIRRHRVVIPEQARARTAVLLRELATAKALAGTRAAYQVAADRSRLLHPFGSSARSRIADPAAAALAAAREVEFARRRLRAWAAQQGVERRTEGWVPTGEGTFGAWVPLEETPDELIERSYPMRLLPPSPEDPDHVALSGSIYWALVPTGSDEVGADGSARFGDLLHYEIRAYARPQTGSCPGPLTWSEPGEPFGLAALTDPDGCAQRPVELRTPDLRALEASTAPPSVRVSSPPGSGLSVPHTGDLPGEDSGSVNPNEQICFFSIPLFTIVAFFVFNLFLPILMLALGLWWMLKLKFCLPPSIEMEADLSAELAVVPGGISASLEIDVDVFPGVDKNAIATALKAGMDGTLLDADGNPTGPPGGLPVGLDVGSRLTAEFTNDPILELLARQGYSEPVGAGPVFHQGFAYTARVGRDEVVHP